MARLKLNNLSGIRSGVTLALTSGGADTTATWSADPGFPTIASPDVAAVPVEGDSGNEEIIWITAHTAGATTSTCVRAKEGTAKIAHAATKNWYHGPTALDAPSTGNVPGAPTTGAHEQYEVLIDSVGTQWTCTVAGTPGTWVCTGGNPPGVVPSTHVAAVGHSWLVGYGVSNHDRSIPSMLSGASGAVVENFGIQGAQTANTNLAADTPYLNTGGSGGWVSVLQNQVLVPSRTAAPRVPNGYVGLCLYGGNDLGYHARDLGNNPRTAFKNALRTVLARLSAGQVFEDTDASVAYTSGSWLAAVASILTNSGASYRPLPLGGGSFTITIPADFEGGTVDVGLIAFSNSDAVITWSGTAALTGGGNPSGTTTLSAQAVNSAGGAATATRSSSVGVVKRFAVNTTGATQTIIGTFPSSTNGGGYDYWAIEATNPTAPVIVCGTPRFLPGGLPLQGAGGDGGFLVGVAGGGYCGYGGAGLYTGIAITAGGTVGATTVTINYGALTAAQKAALVVGDCIALVGGVTEAFYINAVNTGTGVITLSNTKGGQTGFVRNASHTTVNFNSPSDVDVANYNTDIQAVVAEFPSTVKFVDVDTLIGLNPLHYYTDGLHLNDRGASVIAGAAATTLGQIMASFQPFQVATVGRGPRKPENVAIKRTSPFEPYNVAGGYTDLSLTATVWTDLNDSTGAPWQVILAAKPGDLIQVNMQGLWSNLGAMIGQMDCCTMTALTAGSVISSLGGNCASANIATANYGVGSWAGLASTYTPITGSIFYTVQPADVVAGITTMVILRLRFRLASAGTKTIYQGGSGVYQMEMMAKNLGVPSPTASQ